MTRKKNPCPCELSMKKIYHLVSSCCCCCCFVVVFFKYEKNDMMSADFADNLSKEVFPINPGSVIVIKIKKKWGLNQGPSTFK